MAYQYSFVSTWFIGMALACGGCSADSKSTSMGSYVIPNPGAPGGGGGNFVFVGPNMVSNAAPTSTAAGAAAENTADAAAAASDAGDQCASLDATKPQRLYLSADDSNSMASPAIARSIINLGGIPPATIIRTYEFLNYYDLGYERAAAGQLAITLEMRPGDDAGSYALQIGVSSEAARVPRRPINVTFVLDTSGSMGGEPIARSQAAVKAIAASLQKSDIVSAVTWNDSNTIVMDSHVVTGPNDNSIIAMATAMQANGSTNLNAGLTVGYSLAQKNYVASYLNRVVLISDGQANTGVTDENIIAKAADLNDGDGIYLVGVGVGDGVNDTLMNVVTDKGRGAYVYLDTAAEASRMFVTRFDETMDVAARAVQVRLDLPWYLGVAQFYGEQISADPKLVEPQHLAPNDAMVFDQILQPCSAQRFVAGDAVTVTADWLTPTTHEPRSTSTSTTLGTLLESGAEHLPKASAIIAYAEALKAGATPTALSAARTKVAAARAHHDDSDLVEIDQLLARLAGN